MISEDFKNFVLDAESEISRIEKEIIDLKKSTKKRISSGRNIVDIENELKNLKNFLSKFKSFKRENQLAQLGI